MSPRRWVERVKDILEAIDEIQAFTRGMDFDTFHRWSPRWNLCHQNLDGGEIEQTI